MGTPVKMKACIEASELSDSELSEELPQSGKQKRGALKRLREGAILAETGDLHKLVQPKKKAAVPQAEGDTMGKAEKMDKKKKKNRRLSKQMEFNLSRMMMTTTNHLQRKRNRHWIRVRLA